jgi:hypothetical protein
MCCRGFQCDTRSNFQPAKFTDAPKRPPGVGVAESPVVQKSEARGGRAFQGPYICVQVRVDRCSVQGPRRGVPNAEAPVGHRAVALVPRGVGGCGASARQVRCTSTLREDCFRSPAIPCVQTQQEGVSTDATDRFRGGARCVAQGSKGETTGSREGARELFREAGAVVDRHSGRRRRCCVTCFPLCHDADVPTVGFQGAFENVWRPQQVHTVQEWTRHGSPLCWWP